MGVKDDYSISIRPSTELDIEGVKEVFRDGAFSNIFPAFKLDLQKRAFHYFTVIVLSVMVAVFQGSIGIIHVILTLLCCLLMLLLFEVMGALMYVYGPHSYLADVNNAAKLKEAYLENRDTCFWVAEATNQRDQTREIVGTIAIGHKRTDTLRTTEDRNKKIAWLRRMVVKQKFRRMGIAKRLVLTAVEFCEEHHYDQIELITTDIHAAARLLYERLGFDCASHRQHPYFRGYLKVWMYEYVYHCQGKDKEKMGNNKTDGE